MVIFYIYFQLNTVYGGDSGDFLSTVAVGGIPHPPGYPLYSFLSAILFRIIPWNSPAWRIAFLSSIPSALAICILYRLLKLFVSKSIALTSSLFFAFLYPIWLYSEVVEVFSLNNLLVVIITYYCFKFLQSRKSKFLNLLFFCLGLAFSHHQTIIFLIPALVIVIKLKIIKKYWRSLLYILPGLIFYLYLPLTAAHNPAINWGNPINVTNLLNVILRRNYGTFLAHQNIDNSISGRLLNLIAFYRFIKADFNFTGVFFILSGIISPFFIKKENFRVFWKYALISLLSYTFFLFYASFRLDTDFAVATFERFIIIPYLFLTIFLALGIQILFKLLFKIIVHNQIKNWVQIIIFFIFVLLLPLKNLFNNYHKISILKNDTTAENYSQDILNSLPEKASIFLNSDTSWFDTAYIYYALEYKKNDIQLINFFTLPSDYYRQYLHKTYPLLTLSSEDRNFESFVRDNWETNPVFIIPNKQIESFTTVPYGLGYRYYADNKQPSAEEVYHINEQIWSQFHDPLQGSLKIYKNLFLADIINYYQESSKRLGEYLLLNNKYQEAEKFLMKSLYYNDKDSETYLLLGRVYSALKQCDKAEQQFLQVKKMLPDNPFPDAYLRQVYIDCFKDENKANDFLNSCFDKENKNQPSLEDL